jgi:hypothetical protein
MNVTQVITGAPTTRPRTMPAASAPTARSITDHVHPDWHERRRGVRRIPGEKENLSLDRRDSGMRSCASLGTSTTTGVDVSLGINLGPYLNSSVRTVRVSSYHASPASRWTAFERNW